MTIYSAVDHLHPNLPFWGAVRDPYGTDPTQGACSYRRSCRLYPAAWATCGRYTWYKSVKYTCPERCTRCIDHDEGTDYLSEKTARNCSLRHKSTNSLFFMYLALKYVLLVSSVENFFFTCSKNLSCWAQFVISVILIVISIIIKMVLQFTK